MKLITQRDKIKNILVRWDYQYPNPGLYAKGAATRHALSQLDLEIATPEDIAKIIGNCTWTTLTCDECVERVLEVVEIGDTDSILLCKPCLKKALEL